MAENMFILIIGIAFLSIVLSLFSLKKQSRMEEVHKIKKELKRKKVIFHRGSRV